MYLKCHKRFKDGKEHRYWSIVESVRTRRGVIKRHLLYLGEINDTQRAQWCSALDVLDEPSDTFRQMSIFPEDRPPPAEICNAVQIRLSEMTLHRPRQWGGCWLALELWDQLALDGFWFSRLAASRKGTSWLHVLKTLVCYRLLDPGSEWRLHRDWFKNSAMVDLLGEDDSIAAKNTLYRCLDNLCEHKVELFSFLKERWSLLFNASYDVLLYDLTSTYFECDPPDTQEGLRRFGYSRDKRSDCVQVVIALIVTPEGLPVAYEVMPSHSPHIVGRRLAPPAGLESKSIKITIAMGYETYGDPRGTHEGRIDTSAPDIDSCDEQLTWLVVNWLNLRNDIKITLLWRLPRPFRTSALHYTQLAKTKHASCRRAINDRCRND